MFSCCPSVCAYIRVSVRACGRGLSPTGLSSTSSFFSIELSIIGPRAVRRCGRFLCTLHAVLVSRPKFFRLGL